VRCAATRAGLQGTNRGGTEDLFEASPSPSLEGLPPDGVPSGTLPDSVEGVLVGQQTDGAAAATAHPLRRHRLGNSPTRQDHAECCLTRLRGLGALEAQREEPVYTVSNKGEVRAAGGKPTTVLLLSCLEHKIPQLRGGGHKANPRLRRGEGAVSLEHKRQTRTFERILESPNGASGVDRTVPQPVHTRKGHGATAKGVLYAQHGFDKDNRRRVRPPRQV
jgi:hypothetical protein